MAIVDMDNFSSRKLQAIAIISAIAVSAAAGAFFASDIAPVQQAYSLSADGRPTIKVTGDASATLPADQVTVIVNVQTQPGDLESVLDDQAKKVSEVVSAARVRGNTSITVGQQSLYPYYSGYGTPSSSDVTFNIYASVAISTNIDELSDLVSSLADAGFGFESVYFDSSYSAALLQKAEIIDELVSGNETDSDLTENPITIAVSLNTEPAVLTEALAEYEQKYRDLQGVLEELGIPEDRIQQNSFNIYPYYYGYGYGQGDTYNANTQVIVHALAADLERVIDRVSEVDNAYVENVFMSVSDQAIDEARAYLTAQAIENAEDRAEEIADSLDFEVMSISSIETVQSSSNPYGGEIFYRGVKVIQPYYYQSITGEISVSVTAEFELQDVN